MPTALFSNSTENTRLKTCIHSVIIALYNCVEIAMNVSFFILIGKIQSGIQQILTITSTTKQTTS